MGKRRYLDEVSYLDENGKIHIDVPKRDQGTIQKARSWQRKLTDEIAGSVKAQLKGNVPVSPYLAYPAAGVIASSLFNPIGTITGLVKGAIGAKAVNKIGEISGRGTWGEQLGRNLDINPDVAEFTNPGFLLAGLKSRPSLKQETPQKILTNKTTSLLDVKPIQQIVHTGNKIVMPSSGKVYYAKDGLLDYRRTLLKRINKIFTTRYGYNSIPLKAAETKEATENAIKSLMSQHNTFVRGVGDKPQSIKATNKLLELNGIEPTKENRLRWYATHYAPDTGHGRFGFDSYIYPKDYGTIYTSNMYGVAKGYAEPRGGRLEGGQYIVRRPLDFSSSNLEDWVINNEFMFNGLGDTKSGRNYFLYDLPYYLKHGKTLTKEYLDEHPIVYTDEERADIIKRATDDYFSRYNVNNENQRKRAQTITNSVLAPYFKLPHTIYGDNHAAVAQAKLERALENYFMMGGLKRRINKRIIKSWLKDHPNYYNAGSVLNPKIIKKGTRLPENSSNIFDDFDWDAYERNDKTNEISQFINPNNESYIQAVRKELEKYYYSVRKRGFEKLKEQSKKELDAEITQAFQKRRIKQLKDIDLASYAKEKGTSPMQQRSIVFGAKTNTRNSTKNSDRDPMQHFVFVGPVNTEGLELVRKVPWKEIKDLPSAHGGHWAPWSEGLTRKAKKYGGIIPRRSLANGGYYNTGKITNLPEITVNPTDIKAKKRREFRKLRQQEMLRNSVYTPLDVILNQY